MVASTGGAPTTCGHNSGVEALSDQANAEQIAAEHRELVRTIDRAVARGALHRNTAARKKSQAARVVSGVSA